MLIRCVMVELPKFKCLRCQHSWIPRKVEKPRLCPKCNSAYWDIERKREMVDV